MIGDTLREARERQNLSIKDIEKGTSIRALYIEAIEKGEFDKLPGNAYTKGFIRNYANFLKLDSSKLKKTFGWEPHWHIDEAVSRVIEWTKVYEAGGDIPAVMDKQINDYITKG